MGNRNWTRRYYAARAIGAALDAGAVDMALAGRPLTPEEAAAGTVEFDSGRCSFIHAANEPVSAMRAHARPRHNPARPSPA